MSTCHRRGVSGTLISGFALHWALGIPVLAALVFGAIVAATDPISVLAIFKDMAVDKRLTIIVEGESLFNDGTAVVLYGILFGAVANSHLGILAGLRDFVVEVAGGITVGASLGYVFSKLTQRIDDPEIEITLTTVLAYGSYLLAQSLHLSGVIATVAAGLMIGNFGVRTGMSSRARIALWSFWSTRPFLSTPFCSFSLDPGACGRLVSHVAGYDADDSGGACWASTHCVRACSYQQLSRLKFPCAGNMSWYGEVSGELFHWHWF